MDNLFKFKMLDIDGKICVDRDVVVCVLVVNDLFCWVF